MEYEIKDPLARLLGIRVERVKDNGIVTGLEIRPDFRNPYFLTHGGCLYTLGHITAALTATSPERSQSAVVYAMDGGVTLRSAFTYTASENRTVYTKQWLGELTAEGGEMIVTENGSHDGRAVTPDEGITLSDLSLALSYFSAVTFDAGEETLTMNAYLSDVAVASVFGRAPTGGTGFCLHILLSGDRITELCLSYRTSNASVTVQSQYAY